MTAKSSLAPRAPELSQELSGRGLRATRQRIALLRLLRAAPGHPTALELHKLLRREQRSVSRKTVYEILNSFGGKLFNEIRSKEVRCFPRAWR